MGIICWNHTQFIFPVKIIIQVFEFLVQGLAGKQIAFELGISYRTVEKFRGKVMQKMEAESVAELVHTAFRIGSLSSDACAQP